MTTTDISPSLESVLLPNIESNTRNRSGWEWGPIRGRKLDWFEFVDDGTGIDAGVVKARAWMRAENEEPARIAITTTTPTNATPDQTRDLDFDYDYMITTDTLYSPPLTLPLLSTLRSFSLACASPPPILVALETRDPLLIASALNQAKEMGFSCRKIAGGRVEKALVKSGWGWDKGDRRDWEGIEVWRWKYVGVEVHQD